MHHTQKSSIIYCHNVLPKVSRTFAISIEHLKKELNASVMVGYLLCRICDTIEDCPPSVDIKVRLNLFDQLSLIFGHYNETNIQNFQSESRKLNGNKDHIDLNLHMQEVMDVFFGLSSLSQKIIKKWVLEMNDGMRSFVEKYPDGVKIQTLEEYKLYCYYVAGVVGRMLTELWKGHCKGISEKNKKILDETCEAFGEGLQTVNILKDIAEDAVDENNFYVPFEILKAYNSSHEKLIDDSYRSVNKKAVNQMIEHAEKSMWLAYRYYMSLPYRYFNVNLFCLVPMLFAFATLRELKKSDDMLKKGGNVKITRREVKKIIFFARIIVLFKFLTKKIILRLLKK